MQLHMINQQYYDIYFLMEMTNHLQILDVHDSGGGRQHCRRHHKARDVPLDLQHVGQLIRHCVVVMDEAHAAQLRL